MTIKRTTIAGLKAVILRNISKEKPLEWKALVKILENDPTVYILPSGWMHVRRAVQELKNEGRITRTSDVMKEVYVLL
jgi:hypothetical protein